MCGSTGLGCQGSGVTVSISEPCFPSVEGALGYAKGVTRSLAAVVFEKVEEFQLIFGVFWYRFPLLRHFGSLVKRVETITNVLDSQGTPPSAVRQSLLSLCRK